MAHRVKCIYCKEMFDRDKISCIKVSERRYAHTDCAVKAQSNKSVEQQEKESLEDYIKQIFNETSINIKIKKQIEQYMKEYNYSYSGIKKALVYWIEVKHKDMSKSNNGIGIVPYIYKDAYNYYYALWEAQQKNESKDISFFAPKDIEVKIKRPERRTRRKHLFTFLDDMEEDIVEE